MDPVQQIEVRDLMMIKPKTNPKPINGGRVHFHALLHLFVTILLFAYFLPGLRCYFGSVNISSAELANLLVSKKALFLFSNIILILLVIDFTLSGTSNSFTNTLHNDHSASLEGHLPSDSNAIVVGDDSLWLSSSLQVEELISSEQKGTISVDSFAEEKQSAKEESITNIDILFVDFLTGIIGDDTEWRSEYSNKSHEQGQRRMITVEGGSPTPKLEVVVIGQGRTKLETFDVADDQLERLELDELNRKFDEFIQREKNKWRSIGNAAASHGSLIRN